MSGTAARAWTPFPTASSAEWPAHPSRRRRGGRAPSAGGRSPPYVAGRSAATTVWGARPIIGKRSVEYSVPAGEDVARGGGRGGGMAEQARQQRGERRGPVGEQWEGGAQAV